MEQLPQLELEQTALMRSKYRPWMQVAVIGIFHLGVGYFFGHRYRAGSKIS